ncbi:SIS domain-containing protein [Ornithinimicrobium sp. Y1847]|uniref:SIS domain-containing protein n=1 Tax=Ornithinimicrobium sp. Y1847 TaxID=3405419 RepID=UPI003B66F853
MSTFLSAELASQPQIWQAVANRVDEVRSLLPQRGERVAAVGCGTSWFMSQAYAARREQLGHGETDAFTASEFPLGRNYDRVVLITRSGTTTEVVRLLDDLKADGRRHVSIVATPDTPVADQAQDTLLLPEADEQSVVQTRFATSALAALRLSLDEDLTPAITQAQRYVDASDSELLAGLADAEQVTFLGTGFSIGLAHEAALKLREAAQFWTESYPAMEYRHGPISIAAPGRVVWVLGEIPEGLADDVRATGAHLEHVPGADPMAELVRVHRYSLLRATLAGVDPDAPRNLTRSIILT